MEALDVKVKITNKDQVLKIYTDESGFSIPKIAMRALNMTADQIKVALVEEMQRKFDRPTPFTLNAPYVVHAKPGKLFARVMLREFGSKGIVERYLLTQVHGGDRALKSFEKSLQRVGVLPQGMYATPGKKAPLDAYGNMSRGFIVQIISYFKAFGEQGYRANITDKKKASMAKSRRGKQGAKFGIEYFIVKKRDKHNLAPGIWRRLIFNNMTRSVEPVIMFISKPTYSKLLEWEVIAQKVIDQNWVRNFKEAGAIDG